MNDDVRALQKALVKAENRVVELEIEMYNLRATLSRVKALAARSAAMPRSSTSSTNASKFPEPPPPSNEASAGGS